MINYQKNTLNPGSDSKSKQISDKTKKQIKALKNYSKKLSGKVADKNISIKNLMTKLTRYATIVNNIQNSKIYSEKPGINKLNKAKSLKKSTLKKGYRLATSFVNFVIAVGFISGIIPGLILYAIKKKNSEHSSNSLRYEKD